MDSRTGSGMTDDCGISQTEAYVLLENDIQNCEKQLVDELPEQDSDCSTDRLGRT